MRRFNVTVNGKSYSVDVEEVTDGAVSPAPAPAPVAAKPAAAPVAAGEGTPVKCPMPGLILGLSLADGAKVKKDEKILVLEAMKMENDINAPCDGVVTYAVKKGDNVETGAVLAYIR